MQSFKDYLSHPVFRKSIKQYNTSKWHTSQSKQFVSLKINRLSQRGIYNLRMLITHKRCWKKLHQHLWQRFLSKYLCTITTGPFATKKSIRLWNNMKEVFSIFVEYITMTIGLFLNMKESYSSISAMLKWSHKASDPTKTLCKRNTRIFKFWLWTLIRCLQWSSQCFQKCLRIRTLLTFSSRSVLVL